MTKGLKQQQSERTRGVLIRAATALLLDRGYAGTTLSLLAQGVGMTKGAIYHHFPDKEALLRAVIEHVRRTWEGEVGAHVPAAGDALDRLGAVFERQAQLIDREPSLCLLVNGLALESESLGQELADDVARLTSDFVELVRSVLVDGQRARAVRTDLDAKAMAHSIVAVVKAISCSRAADPSRSAFVKKMDTTRTLILSGIRASAGVAHASKPGR
jgi:AcrR family transcriptional regulator